MNVGVHNMNDQKERQKISTRLPPLTARTLGPRLLSRTHTFLTIDSVGSYPDTEKVDSD